MLAILFLWLLVGPRIELPGLHGLRVEDLVFAVMAVLCVLHARGLTTPAGPTIAAFAVAGAGVVSALVASARGMVDPVTSVLFAVRPLEYWIAFPAALLLLRSADRLWLRRIDPLLGIVTVLQTLFAVLQYYFGLEVGFSHAAYTRAAGLTVGPYELGAISAVLVVYWVARGAFTFASLAVIALAASISRVSLLGAGIGLLILAVFWITRTARRVARDGWRTSFPLRASRVRVVVQAVSVVVAALVLAFTVGIIHAPPSAPEAGPRASGSTSTAPSAETSAEASHDTSAKPTAPPSVDSPAGPTPPNDSFVQRLETTSVLGSWFSAQRLADRAPEVQTAAEYADVAYAHLNAYVTTESAAAEGAEPSNLVRFFRWHLILQTFDDPVDYLLGLGPSFTGPSVDGSYLRMFADGGVLGVLAWLLLIVMWLRRSPLWMRCITVALLVGALFIDILYAQRPMVLYWLVLAVAVSRRPSEVPVSAGSDSGR